MSKGIVDLLPPDAASPRALAARVRSTDLSGHDLLTPPSEHADVVQRGNDVPRAATSALRRARERRDRALRPDITPQIAPIVATRLEGSPGTVSALLRGRVQPQRGRARRHRQRRRPASSARASPAPSAADPGADDRACENVGLTDFQEELRSIRLLRSLLLAVPEDARSALSEVWPNTPPHSRDRGHAGSTARSVNSSRRCSTTSATAKYSTVRRERFRTREAAVALRNLRESWSASASSAWRPGSAST